MQRARTPPDRTTRRATASRLAIRPVVPSDIIPLAAAYHRSWQAAYRGIVPHAILDGLRLPDYERRRSRALHRARARGWGLWLAVLNGRVAGFVEAGPCRDADADGCSGEIYAIYLDPSAQGRRLGRPLMARAIAWLRRRRFSEGRLWVLRGNHRAARFYRAAGWRADGTLAGFRIGGYPVVERRYRRRLMPLGRG